MASKYGEEYEQDENTPLVAQTEDNEQYGSMQSIPSWSARTTKHPYDEESKPKRKPYHISLYRRPDFMLDSVMYSRFQYYSRLRAPVEENDDVLVMPDHIVPSELFVPYIPGHKKDADGKQDSFVTVIAIWNTMMGTSLLTMPWAFGQAGFIGGFLIMFIMAALALYTAYRMLTLQRTMGLEGEMHEIFYLCKQLWPGNLGKVIEAIAITFSFITLLGALVVYWVLMSNFLFNTGEVIYDVISHTNTTKHTGLICSWNNSGDDLHGVKAKFVQNISDSVTTLPNNLWQIDLSVPLYLIFPFAFILSIRDPKIFTYFNSLGAISVLAVYTFVIYKAGVWGFNFTLTDPTSPMYVPFFKTTFMALSGTLSLAYFIHNCIISILKGNRNSKNNVRDLSISYFLVMITYIPIGVIFYLSFPLPKSCLDDNFLNNFPTHNAVIAIVRGFLFFQMLTVFPLLMYVVRTQLSSYFFGTSSPISFQQITYYNAIVVTFCIIFAIFYPNIGFIIRWVGAMTGLVYIFLIPCASYMQALSMKSELSIKSIIFHTFLILIGIGNFVAQFFVS